MNQPLPEFQYKISLGQNFLFDQNLLRSLVAEAPFEDGAIVLEIGAGRGDLTEALLTRAGRVVAIEIDPRLQPVLETRFSEVPNFTLAMGDVMDMDLAALMAGSKAFHVVANLPYYLTTPILNRLLLLEAPLKSISVMVQEEAARRVMASPGTGEYGPLAVLTAYRGSPRVAARVPARFFTPPPKVDSVFLTIPLYIEAPVDVVDQKHFLKVVQAAFAMRRKTLANNLVKPFSISRETAVACIQSIGLPANIRGERLSLQEFAGLSRALLTNQL